MGPDPVDRAQRSGCDDSGDSTAQRMAYLERRIATMERRQQRSRRLATALILVAAAAATLGMASEAPDVLSAREFQLLDSAGHVRASWSGRSQDGVEMLVYDDAGKPTTTLALTEAEPYLAVVSARDLRKQSQGRRWFSWGRPATDAEQAPESDGRPSWSGKKPDDEDEGAFEWDGK